MASILSTIQLETTSTSGTLTSEQLTTLQESKTNYIVYGTELFKLVDNNTSGDTLIYTCSTNDNGTLKVKSITVTISTLAWTYSELSSGGSSGTKKYQHNVNFSNSSNYNLEIYFSYISDKSTSSMNITALLEDIKNTYSFIRLIANGIFEYADVFYNISYIQVQGDNVYAYGFDNTGKSQSILISSGAIGITDTVVEI